MRIVDVNSLNALIWKAIRRLYLSDPLIHVYLMYDLIYYFEDIKLYFAINKSAIIGYILIWHGPYSYGVHLWGKVNELLKYIPINGKVIIQVYDKSFVGFVVDYLKERGLRNIDITTYINMVVFSNEFKAFKHEGITLLNSSCEEHLQHFIRLKEVQGISMDKSKAMDILYRYRYYGLFVEDKLVSTACAYLRMPEVWIIGDVFTHPDYRGRGYAKAVTSAITNDAIVSGAKALLHVRADNKPAIRVYRAIGYKEISRRPWIMFSKHYSSSRSGSN